MCLNVESVAEIGEEGNAELHAGLHEAEQDIAGIPACVADSSAGDLALGCRFAVNYENRLSTISIG